MNVIINIMTSHRPVTHNRVPDSDLKIALQSALAAALCLGLPTGLYFWLITLQRAAPSPGIDHLVTFFSSYLVPPDILGRIGAFTWGFLLSKISGYRQWWWPSLASMAGFWLGDYALYHGLLPEGLPALSPRGLSPPVQFGAVLAITVLSVTVSTGVLLGFTLMSWKASLVLAVSTGSAATLAAVVTLMILDGFGIRVGSGNAAMPKATAAATMAAALAGGTVLGVMFSRYARRATHSHHFCLIMTLLMVWLQTGCQSVLAPLPTPIPISTVTATPGTMLRDAPATLATTALPTVEGETFQLFEYDRSAPLDIEAEPILALNGYNYQDLTYTSPKGGRVPATLLVPASTSGPFAGVILMHGLPGDRTNNASFARGLVATGAVVLMIDAPFARPENRSRSGWPLTFDQTDRLEQIQLIVDLRRGVDLLSAREDVDPERLAYIGYSYGAAMGGLLAGIEPRLKAFGLMVGDGGIVSHFTDSDGSPLSQLNSLPAQQRQAWLELMEPIEPIRFVGRAAPAHLFFQNALRDEAVARDDALAYQSAGSEPKRIEWYESGHMLPPEAFRRMADWLGEEIGIDATRFIPFVN